MDTQIVEFQYVDGADPGLNMPSRGTPGSSGYDLRANLASLRQFENGLLLKSKESRLVPTGIRDQFYAFNG